MNWSPSEGSCETHDEFKKGAVFKESTHSRMSSWPNFVLEGHCVFRQSLRSLYLIVGVSQSLITRLAVVKLSRLQQLGSDTLHSILANSCLDLPYAISTI